MFLRLGYINAVRNLARSLTAVISMAVAAVFLTTTISLTGGYPKDGYLMYRQWMGGEVVAYAAKFTGALPSGESAEAWSLVHPEPDVSSDLPIYHPELYTQGFLSEGGRGISSFSQEQIEQISNQSGVADIYPYYLLPAQSVIGSAKRYSTPLRGRDLAKDQLTGGLEQYVTSGRYLTPDDEGKLVAVVNSYQFLPNKVSAPTIGSKVRVEIPTLTVKEGQPVFNYQQRMIKEFEVVGTLEMPTRVVQWKEMEELKQEQLYWHTQEIVIPLSTWQALYREAGAQSDFLPVQIAIHIPDMSTLEKRITELGQVMPEVSFISVARRIPTAISRGQIDRAYRAPAYALGYQQAGKDSAVPMDLRSVLLTVLYLISALIVAANMLISINERKQEMGILKAVGARRRDVMSMVLAEALLISAMGATIGFVSIEIFSIFNKLSNDYTFLAILGSTLKHYGVILGSTALASLLFGMIPALKLSRLTAMEILRQE